MAIQAHPLPNDLAVSQLGEHAAKTLDELDVPHEVRVLSAHRTPDVLLEYAATAHTSSREWADQHRAAFCRGYAQAGGPDPATQEVLFRAFEFDKAVYEVLYEARNRPTWLHVPLGSLAHLVS